MLELTPEKFQQSFDTLLASTLQNFPKKTVNLCVALSGGVDSVVLLHLLSRTQTLSTPAYSIKAIHVNHQLNSAADEWQLFCISLCEKLNIHIDCISVDATIKQGEGPEAAARNARYDAFRKKCNTDDLLLTAHHLDDQIETVFLQMLRGTGVDGAAGMNSITEFNQSLLVRPLLAYSKTAIRQYATDCKLEWVDDSSNTELSFDRNYLRYRVLPAIENRWSSYRETIGRFSQHMRTTSELLNQISKNDFDSTAITNGEDNSCLSIELLNDLSHARKINVVRYWLKNPSNAPSISPSMAQLQQIESMMAAREDADPIVCIAQCEIRRYQQCLYLVDKNQNPDPVYFSKNVGHWNVGKTIDVPGFGELTLEAKKGEGIRPAFFISENIVITLRKGGEKCHPSDRDKPQLLKKVFQEKKIVPWKRNSIPLIYIDGKIAAVFDEFYCKPFSVETDAEEGLVIVKKQ